MWIRRRQSDVWIDNADWLRNVCMSKATFDFICNRLNQAKQRNRTRFRAPIPVGKKVAVALWRLATNIEYRGLGHLFGIGRSTASEITRDFCQAIVNHRMPSYVKFPTGEALRDIVTGFEDRWGFPQFGGAVDGCHIPIIGPAEHHTDFYNRKGWYSVVMQGVVDFKYRFLVMQVGLLESVHDARVFRNTGLYEKGSNGTLFPQWPKHMNGINVPILLLGDPAYPLLTWLMKPFPRVQQNIDRERAFNYRHSRARMIVEDAFDRLTGRWRYLLKRYDCHHSKLPDTVGACVTLRNICESHKDIFDENWLRKIYDEIGQQPCPRADVAQARNGAVAIRNDNHHSGI